MLTSQKNYSVHVDCDNCWVYENELGIKSNYSQNYIYDISLRRLLDLFNNHEIKATFFIIGKDLEINSCIEFCKTALAQGHKIGNHSLSHPKNFGKLNFEERKVEIVSGHNLIFEKLNYPCKSFRAPGYGVQDKDLSLLAEMGYIYDSSTLPGYTTLIIKLLTLHSKEYRTKSLNVWQNLIASTKTKKFQLRNGLSIWRVPVGVMPFLRLPIHTSFLFLLGPTYLKIAQFFLTLSSSPKIILFHGLDLSDQASGADKSIVPTFNTSYIKRYEICNILLSQIKNKTLHLEEILN